jgi:hypothetical protein
MNGRWQRRATGIALTGLAGCAVAVFAERAELAEAWLSAWFVVWELALGSLAMLMLHPLTGGRWGEALQPALRTGALLLPAAAIMFLPLFAGLDHLYTWLPALEGDGPAVTGWYLNEAFFVARIALYLVLWPLLAVWLARADGPAPRQGVASAVLVLYALTVTTSSIDFVMALTPHWSSTIFGMLLGTTAMLAGLNLALLRFTLIEGGARIAPEQLHDVAGLLFMLVLLWAYLAFMQMLTVWVADLPREIRWYLPRRGLAGGAVALLVTMLNFVVPFVVLLSSRAKRSVRALGRLSVVLLTGQILYAWWLVIPSVRGGIEPDWVDPFALAALLGLGAMFYRIGDGRSRAGSRAAQGAGHG